MQRKNEANIINIWSPQRNYHSYNDDKTLQAMVCSPSDDTNIFDIITGV